jgi:uncharacterized membrane protein YeiB
VSTPITDQSEPVTAPSFTKSDRLIGFDVARSIAILGMILVHFSLVLSGNRRQPWWLGGVLTLLDGRAAATFVVLAGVGIALRSRKVIASGDHGAKRRIRAVLLKRGLFLLAAGFVNLVIWPGDILRVYGVSFLIAAWWFDVSDRRLWTITLAFVAGFIMLMTIFDFEKNWDWDTLTYHKLWTVSGVIRNLFYDGFRGIFPWTGFLFFGIWLGRRNIADAAVCRRAAWIGAAVTLVVEVISRVLIWFFSAPRGTVPREVVVWFLGTESIPPLPFFLLASGGCAVTVIALAVAVAQCWPTNWLVKALAATGQMAFTWYMAHIVLGLGTIVALDFEDSQSLAVALACGFGFFAVTLPISLVWMRIWKIGPLEWLMRRLAGG